MDTADSGDMYNLWNNVLKNPILGYHVYLHFMEIQILNASQSRLIDIYFNNKIFMTGFQPKYLYTDTLFNADPLSEIPNAFYNLSASNGSTLPPLLNAAELYAAINWAINASTFGQDVDAIQQIKWAYGVKRNWMGDPCLPHAYSWEGLACSNDNLPRIISLNLSSSGLNGKISASFADLKLIQTLDLSGNNLVGNIPDFLAQLSSLTLLNLDNNHLSGSIPLPLLQRQSLTLGVIGNPELCKSESCQKHSKHIWIIVVVAVVIATTLLLLVLWKLLCLRRKQKGLTEVSGPIHQGEHMNCFGVGFSTSLRKNTDSAFKYNYSTSADGSTIKGETRDGSFRLDNLEFTDADVVTMTNNFTKEIGKGGFGTVYLGEKSDGTQVAVKRLKEMSQGSRMFLNEIAMEQKIGFYD
ncbi:putative leucine-rich repeat receptor-like protein kinase [Acorus gramineus]|uniref:Leucine-rich repeat receptor-like protein kinase n=1 Tax=Acorus gramineus TaxID=55184 RepID=A0AAV9AMR4_ACOGR|nr:putative leucine-rich repeat receptor-like protein kinase [Acorus gramineus]